MMEDRNREKLCDILKDMFRHPRCKKVFQDNEDEVFTNVVWKELWGVMDNPKAI
jgi:uncharacterized C2H2 Zn-finger protein